MASDNFFLGFKAVPAKYDEKCTLLRWLFIKRHSVRDKIPEKPVNRTLLVINVPPFCNEVSLNRTFSVCGPVSNVYCHASPTPFLPPKDDSKFFSKNRIPNTYKVAYVVFKSAEGLSKALKLSVESPLLLSFKDVVVKTGMSKWSEEYDNAILSHAELQEEIDKFMDEFDAEERRKEHEAEMAGEPDEEGWITVTSKSKKRGIVKTVTARKKILDKAKLKRSQKELKNFYRFQIRESKMKHLENLRRKFNEDKKKIDAFKQSRKFKPF